MLSLLWLLAILPTLFVWGLLTQAYFRLPDDKWWSLPGYVAWLFAVGVPMLVLVVIFLSLALRIPPPWAPA